MTCSETWAKQDGPVTPIAEYADAGRRAARAMRAIDLAEAERRRAWLSGRLLAERPAYKPVARAAYNDAYRDTLTATN